MTAAFLGSQMDYIFFLCGLVFFLLATACLCLHRHNARELPWGYLAWFGLLQAVSFWCDALVLSFGDGQVFAYARLGLVALSFVCLCEFSRSGTIAVCGKGPGRWIFVPLVCLVALGSLAGIRGLLIATHCVLGSVGALLATWVTWQFACREHRGGGSLRVSAVGMALYAIAGGILVPEASFGPVQLLGRDTSGQVTGLPIYLIQFSLAIVIAIGIWRHYQTLCVSENADLAKAPRYGLRLGLALIAVLAGGWITTELVGKQARRAMEHNLLSRAVLACVAVDVESAKSLNGVLGDMYHPTYEGLKGQLGALCRSNPDCRFVYLMARQNQDVVFLVDSEPADSPDCSPPGQVYGEASEQYRAFFESPRPFVEGPYADRWGVWVSGLVPLYEQATGSFVAALGMDVDARDWMGAIYVCRLGPVSVTLLLSLIATGFFLVEQRSRESAMRVAASERSYRSLVESSPNSIVLLDGNGVCLTINQNGLQTMGWSDTDVVGKPFVLLWPEESRPLVEDAVRMAVGGEQVSFEADCAHSDGRILTWQMILNPVQTDSSPTSRLVAIGIDITDRKWAEKEQAERLRRLQAQQAVTARLSTDRSLASRGFEGAVQLVTELAVGALRVARASIWLLSEDRQAMRCVDLYADDSQTHSSGMVLNSHDYPQYFRALQTGRVIDAGNAQQDPRTCEFASDYLMPLGITSMLDAAICVGGEIVGVACFEHVGSPRAWHPDETTYAGVIADNIAQSLANAKRLQMEEALRESETRLRIIQDSIPAGVVLVEADSHRIVDVNPAAAALFGAARSDIVGHVCHRFICPAEVGRCPVTDLSQSVCNTDKVLVGANGEHRQILKTVVPITLGGRRHLLESFVDISDRKQAELELAAHRECLEELVNERTKQLLDAERTLHQQDKLASVGQLAAGIAHEINTPIQYVGDNLKALSDNFSDLVALEKEYRDLVELVKAGADAADKIKAIDEIAEACDVDYILEDTPKAIAQGLEGVDRVARIVRAMKDFSHIDRGEIALVDINLSLGSTLTVARNEYKYVADVETYLNDLPMVECYASEINQVFLNLLVNAAHAIADTKQRGRITIRTRAVGDQVEVAIADTGTGIPDEIRKRIFDPFFTTKEVGKGTGQGLSIAHQIVVLKHKGALTFDSEVGKGTTFYVRLPIRIAKSPEVSAGVTQA